MNPQASCPGWCSDVSREVFLLFTISRSDFTSVAQGSRGWTPFQLYCYLYWHFLQTPCHSVGVSIQMIPSKQVILTDCQQKERQELVYICNRCQLWNWEHCSAERRSTFCYQPPDWPAWPEVQVGEDLRLLRYSSRAILQPSRAYLL